MDKREYSLLYRLYCDRSQYKYAYSAGTLIEYYNNTSAGKALKEEYGYYRWSSIYDALHQLKTPRTLYLTNNGQDYYGSSCLVDFYTHDGERLKRSGWVQEWIKERQKQGKTINNLYLK